MMTHPEGHWRTAEWALGGLCTPDPPAPAAAAAAEATVGQAATAGLG